MSGVLDKHELGRLRTAELSPFDINFLKTMVETGGEFPFYPERVSAENRDRAINGIISLCNRGLIDLDQVRSSHGRWILHMTDHGRQSYASLDRLNVQRPSVEVQMHDGVPDVVRDDQTEVNKP